MSRNAMLNQKVDEPTYTVGGQWDLNPAGKWVQQHGLPLI